jgi:prevent-host-death family protein
LTTISVSDLKTHLSAELKRVRAGTVLTVVDHRHPVAQLIPMDDGELFVSEAAARYEYRDLAPLMKNDPLRALEEERRDSW